MKVFGVSVLTIVLVLAVFYIGRKTTIGGGLLPAFTG
jgi:hypothetical protein